MDTLAALWQADEIAVNNEGLSILKINDPKSQASFIRNYAVVLIIIADALLLLMLFLIRRERVTDTDTPYFTLEFLLLLALVAALILVPLIALRWRPVSQWIKSRAPRQRLWTVAILTGICALGVAAAGTVRFLASYAAPFILWFGLVWVGLSGLLLLDGRELSKDSETQPQAGSEGAKASASSRPNLSRVLLLIFLSVVVPLLIAEFGLRFYFSTFGTEVQRVAYLYSAGEITRQTTRFRGVPYVNFGLSPEFESHNSLGYRGPEIAIPKPEGVFRIVAMGGSTTYGFDMTYEESYPAQLERILVEEYGYTQIEVINAGVPYYTSWETLANFQFRVLDLQPDMVLIYDGINDLNARAHLPEHYAGIPASAGLWNPRQPDPGPSTLYRFIAISLGWQPDPNALTTRFYSWLPHVTCCEQYTHEEIAAHFAANPPIYFERNLRNVVAIADVNAVQVVFSSWTYYPDPTANDMNLMALDYRQEAIAEQNEVLRRLGEETSAEFYDLHAAFPYNPDYWLPDGIHMTPPGTAHQARLYAEFLVDSGLLPR